MKTKSSTKILLRLGILIFALLLIGGLSKALRVKPQQPIRFNHHKHIEEVGLNCDECHVYVKTQPFAGIPDLELCLGCHEDPQTDNPEEEKLRNIKEKDGVLVWQQIYHVPDHVYFSHRRHVTAGEIDCVVCPGRMTDRKKPPTKPAVHLDMDHCIECHQQNQVNNDCLACHR